MAVGLLEGCCGDSHSRWEVCRVVRLGWVRTLRSGIQEGVGDYQDTFGILKMHFFFFFLQQKSRRLHVCLLSGGDGDGDERRSKRQLPVPTTILLE